MPGEFGEGVTKLVAAALARPVTPLSPSVTCGDVYERMLREDALLAVPVLASDRPVGLVDRVTLMTDFARRYWRELFVRKPITKLMDAKPLIVDAEMPVEAVGLELVTSNPSALNSGFIVLRNGRYFGIGSSIDLWQHIANRESARAYALEAAHRRIRAFNEELEHRVEERTAELRRAQDELVRRERLSVLGQLTATVAHELRNPLSAIRNTMFTVKEILGTSRLDLERPLGRIERGIVRCDRIITDLLDYTRGRTLRPTTLAADRWLAEVLDEQSLPAGVVMLRQLGASDCLVRFDPDQMRRAVINLIENAGHALGEPTSRERRITVSTQAADGRYELVVEDTGSGIPPDVLAKVFEPLFTTKSFGTGLGLPTVKQIVEQHAGTIALASEPGKGTRVAICLPYAMGQEIAA